MAVIWQKHDQGLHYEVRKAGNSLRLYTDGIFHSQWNASRPFSGHLWDLLFLPTLLHPNPYGISKALVLGVGGGTLINLFEKFLNLDRIDGVDVDKNHLAIARRFFLAKKSLAHLQCEDARNFLKRHRKPAFDVVVDDLFLGQERDSRSKGTEAVRPIAVDDAWLKALKAPLRANGIVVINFESSEQLRRCLTRKRLKALGFCHVFEFCNTRYENAVAGLCTSPANATDFNATLKDLLERFERSAVRDLRFTIEKIV